MTKSVTERPTPRPDVDIVLDHEEAETWAKSAGGGRSVQYFSRRRVTQKESDAFVRRVRAQADEMADKIAGPVYVFGPEDRILYTAWPRLSGAAR
jgi:thymidylate kinase